MYCVVYEFRVKPECASAFVRDWARFTEAIYRVSNSLGSRLHKTADPSLFVAYAQWPSKELFDRSADARGFSTGDLESRASMLASIETLTKRHELEVVDDRLR